MYHNVWILLDKFGLKENNAILVQVSYSKQELVNIFAQVIHLSHPQHPPHQLLGLGLKSNQYLIDPNWLKDKVSRRKDSKCCTCWSTMPKRKTFLSAKGYILPKQTFAIERTFYFCLMKSCILRKYFMSSIAVLPQRMNIASFEAFTKEDINIICQCGFNIVKHVCCFFCCFFFHVLSFFCSFLFLIRNTWDKHDSVNF